VTSAILMMNERLRRGARLRRLYHREAVQRATVAVCLAATDAMVGPYSGQGTIAVRRSLSMTSYSSPHLCCQRHVISAGDFPVHAQTDDCAASASITGCLTGHGQGPCSGRWTCSRSSTSSFHPKVVYEARPSADAPIDMALNTRLNSRAVEAIASRSDSASTWYGREDTLSNGRRGTERG